MDKNKAKERLDEDYNNINNELNQLSKKIKRTKLIISIGIGAIVFMFITTIINIINFNLFFIIVGVCFNIVSSYLVFKNWKIIKEYKSLKVGLSDVKKSINRLMQEVDENRNTNSV